MIKPLNRTHVKDEGYRYYFTKETPNIILLIIKNKNNSKYFDIEITEI